MMRALVLASLALALASCAPKTEDKAAPATAQAISETAAPSEGKDTSALANIQVVTSPGGVTAWLVTEKFVPTIALQVAWKAGSTAEPAGKEGAAWMLGYMMNEGAGTLDSQAFGTRMEELNMSFGCEVGEDWTGCSMSTLKDTASDAFEMARMAFAETRFDAEPIERARRELNVTLEQEKVDPGTMGMRALNKILMPGHPYARYPTHDTVAKITRDDLINLKNQLMTKDRLIVTVVGDITAEELKPQLDRMFGALPATSTLPHVADVVAPPAPPEPVVVDLPIPQTLVLFSGPGFQRKDPDFYTAYVLNYILGGGGFSSRLMDDIREKRGLTYGIGTGLSVQQHLWRWTGSASTKNASASEVVKLIRADIARLGSEGPTEKEVADAKAYITGAYPLNFDSNAKIASNLMQVREDDLGVNYIANRNDLINAVTMDDLKRVAATYLKGNAFTFVEVGQPK
ncbi:MAG: insulinase family protein [Alphaproteobacteria bacterium]|nr:insulinase family protein [Alphaproteobacteria bacterium]